MDPSTEEAETEVHRFKDSLGNLVKPFIKEGKKGRTEGGRERWLSVVVISAVSEKRQADLCARKAS